VCLARRNIDNSEDLVDALFYADGDVLEVVREHRWRRAHVGGHEARVNGKNDEIIVCVLKVDLAEDEVERGLGRT
jgi:hypothetical protein